MWAGMARGYRQLAQVYGAMAFSVESARTHFQQRLQTFHGGALPQQVPLSSSTFCGNVHGCIATSAEGCVELMSECTLRKDVQVRAEGYDINILELTHTTFGSVFILRQVILFQL